jgi:integrase/recombinase XerD
MVVKLTPTTEPCAIQLKDAVKQYLQWMIQNGYAASTIEDYERLLKHFQNFINKRKRPWQAVFDYETLCDFQKNCTLYFAVSAVRGLGRYLVAHQKIASAFVIAHPPLPDIYEDFFRFLDSGQSISPAQIKFTRTLLCALNTYLTKHGISLERLCIEHLDGFIAQYSSGYRYSSRRHIRTYMRKFLKYLYYQAKMTKRDLAPLVVGAVCFARCKPPKFLKSEELSRLFGHLNSPRNKDLRTAAMIHLSYFLGLRPKEVSLIRLDDIGFGKSQVRIAVRKSANPVKLPLPEDTIKIVAAYVIAGRPKSDRRELFLNHHPPYLPVSAATVGHDITSVLKKINSAATAYWLRHTYAQNLLESGASIFELKEMMGHDNIQSARRYLTIHTELMRKVLFDETL